MIFEIVTMIIFGFEKFFKRLNPCHDRAAGLAIEPRDDLVGLILLCFVKIKDHGVVLRPNIMTLSIYDRRIMRGKEYFQQSDVRDESRVKYYPSTFDMTGNSIRNLFVCRIRNMPSAVTRSHGNNTLQHGKNCFRAPEATACKYRRLGVRS